MSRQRAPQHRVVAPMTPDGLRAWKDRMGLRTNQEAADALGLVLKSFENVLYGYAPVSKRTAMVAAMVEAQRAAK